MDALKTYLNKPFVKNISFNKNLQCYSFMNNGVRQTSWGIHKILAKKYYPTHIYKTKDSRPWKRAKKGTTKKNGIKVDDAIDSFIQTNRIPKHPMARVLIDFWQKAGHTILASQVPVKINFPELTRGSKHIITQADVITMDNKSRLWMWEIKSGYPTTPKQKERYLRSLGKEKVPNTRFNHWELQRHYTAEALKKEGVPIYTSRVINVYEQWIKKEKKKVLNIRARKPAPWANRSLPSAPKAPKAPPLRTRRAQKKRKRQN